MAIENKLVKSAVFISDLAPTNVDGKVWAKVLKEQLLSSKNGVPTDEELLYFARVCQASGLDPARREIYGIYRNTKQRDGSYKPKLSIQTSIDGFRVVAERSRKYGGSKEPEFIYDDSFKVTVTDRGSKKLVPNKAIVTVKKVVDGLIIETARSARWEDFYPGDGNDGMMWRKMPETMLAKVAEAQALRAAFPNDAAGLYVEEEMQQANEDDKTDIDLLKKSIANAKDLDDLMDILTAQPADVQKSITSMVDSRAKELQK